jgi:uncharacterized membrane protein YphA (DoxX/SURF4 family)
MNATRYLPFVGRLFIGLPFVVSGLSKLATYGATIGLIASSSLPLPPPLAYAVKRKLPGSAGRSLTFSGNLSTDFVS